MKRSARPTRLRLAFVAGALAVLALPVFAAGHVERPSYWPDPDPDRSIQPAAGGGFPKARTLQSALQRKPPGDTRVVCKAASLRLLRESIARARRNGYDIRPHDHRRLSRDQARKLLRINKQLKKRCEFSDIQAAVTASGNNDRVVIMPGIYKEVPSRAQPTFDPACDKYEVDGDRPGDVGGASYEYQFHCPNDQNLIAVLGREPGTEAAPQPPRSDRHGIPDVGPCIRCNLQIEGSGVSADDVVVEAGRRSAGNGGPGAVGAKKDVGIRVDRADGFVLRNVTVRHALEHGIYVIESDGYLLERFKVYYNGAYGTLTFVEDHGITQDCEAVGSGDSGLYPGAPVESGAQRPEGTKFRYNQIIRRCDSHHNAAGYSATNGNAVHVHHNNFYGNAMGLQTDVATAAGHPGFPGDSTLFEHNNIYSNNFNPYKPDSDVIPFFPYPVGTGLWIAGGNDHIVRRNHIWNNWRRGTMTFAVPDALVCGPAADGNEQAGCDAGRFSTSHRNSFYGNVMGQSPGGNVLPNGTDFWWDSFPGNEGNCWYRNTGPAPITSEPTPLPDCNNGQNPESSVGTGNMANEGELAACAVSFETRTYDPATCPWFRDPPKPGSEGAAAETSAETRAVYRETFLDFCTEFADNPTCEAFEPLPAG